MTPGVRTSLWRKNSCPCPTCAASLSGRDSQGGLVSSCQSQLLAHLQAWLCLEGKPTAAALQPSTAGSRRPGDSCPLQMLHALHLLEQHSPWQLARQMGRMQGKGGTLAALLRLQQSWANGFQKGELQQTPTANPAQAQGHRKMPDQNPAGDQQVPAPNNTWLALLSMWLKYGR